MQHPVNRTGIRAERIEQICAKAVCSFLLLCSFSANALDLCERLGEHSTATPNQLFDAAKSCDTVDDAAYLMILGQIRTLVDIEVFPAKSEPDEALVAKLSYRLYYHMGGAGSDQLYRDKENYNLLVTRLESWKPKNLAAYEPGWNYTSTPTYQGYMEKIEAAKKHRLEQLEGYFTLISDDEYYDLKLQANEILSRNKNTLTKGTEDAEAYSKLSDAMRKVTKRIREHEPK